MPFKNDFDLGLKNFIHIHEKLEEERLTSASQPDKQFIIMYGGDNISISSYKSKSPKLRERLFLEADELIEPIRAEKNSVLKALYSIQKK